MLLLVPAALAHPSALPHVHSPDPAGLALVAFWVACGAMFLAASLRGVAARATLDPVKPPASG